jgi:hypothetical protein
MINSSSNQLILCLFDSLGVILQMIQCTEGHLFCCDCLKKYIEETVFGKGQTEFHCMDSSTHCKAPFPLSQLQRCLPPTMFSKLMEVIQDLEVRKAGLENLEQCPFCDFKMEILNKDDKVFHCQVHFTTVFFSLSSLFCFLFDRLIIYFHSEMQKGKLSIVQGRKSHSFAL